MHIAVFENRFGEYACALRQRQHRHELRLHVSGKGGKGRGGKGKWPQWPIGADLDTIRPFLDRHARFTQTCQYRMHISGIGAHQFQRAASDGCGAGIAPRLYPRSEEHTSELQSLMRISYAVSYLTNK